jgi:hypothetical protein
MCDYKSWPSNCSGPAIAPYIVFRKITEGVSSLSTPSCRFRNQALSNNRWIASESGRTWREEAFARELRAVLALQKKESETILSRTR